MEALETYTFALAALSAALLLLAPDLRRSSSSGSARSRSRRGLAAEGARGRFRSSPQQMRPPWTQLRASGGQPAPANMNP
jgi:hypothetical protein